MADKPVKDQRTLDREREQAAQAAVEAAIAKAIKETLPKLGGKA